APIPIPRALANHPLERLLRRATIKDPTARDVTAAALLRELDACDMSLLDPRAFTPHGRSVIPDVATVMEDRSSRPAPGPELDIGASGRASAHSVTMGPQAAPNPRAPNPQSRPGPDSARATHPETAAPRLVQGERRQITAVSCTLG